VTLDERYEAWKQLVADRPLPVALVDLDAVDANAERLARPVVAAGKSLRVATKSLRCPALLRYLLDKGAPFAGLMSYLPAEAAWLAEHGFDDVLVAYPTARLGDAEVVARANTSGATVSVVVDWPDHLAVLGAAGREHGVDVPVVVEVDTSYRVLGAHLGARRSPLRRPEQVLALVDRALQTEGVSFHGVMGYEAHIAGVQDANPFAPLRNGPKRLLKALSRPGVRRQRQAIAEGLVARGLEGWIFNGGGTGSVDWTSQEACLTEVTAGSGFVDSHLFDYFHGLELSPAISFALQVVRKPDPGFVTCMGGGYVASGEPSWDKVPVPWLPAGLSLLGMEACGEVQTPLKVPAGVELALGDPVFFRHAKAGELAEHFRTYRLVRGGALVDEVPTYRGLEQCFLG